MAFTFTGGWSVTGTTTKTATLTNNGTQVLSISGLSADINASGGKLYFGSTESEENVINFESIVTDPGFDDEGVFNGTKGVLTLSLDWLTTATVKITSKYYLINLEEDATSDINNITVGEPTTNESVWTFSNGTATYKVVKPEYYLISDLKAVSDESDLEGATTITYNKAKDISTLATVSTKIL